MYILFKCLSVAIFGSSQSCLLFTSLLSLMPYLNVFLMLFLVIFVRLFCFCFGFFLNYKPILLLMFCFISKCHILNYRFHVTSCKILADRNAWLVLYDQSLFSVWVRICMLSSTGTWSGFRQNSNMYIWKHVQLYIIFL